MLRHPARAVVVLAAALAGAAAAQPCPDWRWANPLPQGNDLARLAASPTEVVAVGRSGTVLRSADRGASWTTVDPGTDSDLVEVVWTGRDFVALASDSILESTDGTVWTPVALEPLLHQAGVSRPGAVALQAAVVLGGDVVVRGSGGTQLWRTSDGEWHGEGTGEPPLSVTRLVAVPGLVLALGPRFINTSPDGHRWEAGLYLGGADALADAAASSSGIVAVGRRMDPAAGVDRPLVVTSRDGESWQVRLADGVPDDLGLGAVAWDGGRFSGRFLAVGDAGLSATSADGGRWSPLPAAGEDALTDVMAAGDAVVAAGRRGALLSFDGTVWTPRRSGPTTALHAVAAGDDGRFVAVGAGGVAVREDGEGGWLASPTGVDAVLLAVTRFAGRLVAAGTAGAVAVSTDGVTWTPARSGFSGQLRALAGDGVRLVAVGEGGAVLASPDGDTWSRAETAVAETLNAVAAGPPGFVAVGDRGAVITSPDGVYWENRSGQVADYLYGVAWGRDRFVAVGSSGAVAVSADGVAWSRSTVGDVAEGWLDVTWDGVRFTAVNASGRIASSPDGLVWTRERSRTARTLRAVAASFCRRVAVGEAGAVLLGPCPPPPRLQHRLGGGR